MLFLFEEELKCVENNGKEDVQIEKEGEKYEYGMKLQFINCLSFLSTSLEKLVENCTEFSILSHELPQYED